jgi:hypothetical protein
MTDRRLSFVNGLRSFCETAFVATSDLPKTQQTRDRSNFSIAYVREP